MSVKRAAMAQYQQLVDQAAKGLNSPGWQRPPEGWIATVRKALGMSGTQLARRLGVTRARVSKSERSELDGAVTLKSMIAIAEAMNCRFVYAIVPEGRLHDVIRAQAFRKAATLVSRAAGHMALERQSLSKSQDARQIDLMAQDLIHTMPADLWTDSEAGK